MKLGSEVYYWLKQSSSLQSEETKEGKELATARFLAVVRAVEESIVAIYLL